MGAAGPVPGLILLSVFSLIIKVMELGVCY